MGDWSLRLVALAGLVFATVVGGCASGPADFLNIASERSGATNAPRIRDEWQRKALAEALANQSHQQADRASAGDGNAALMALTVMRQQQNEEAQALIVESARVAGSAGPASGMATCDPKLRACPPDIKPAP